MADIQILLFGPPAMTAGGDAVTVSLPAQATCAELNAAIGPGDEVAMIGMVSGG